MGCGSREVPHENNKKDSLKGVAMSEKVLSITDDTFEKEVIKSDLPVLVDFWATWCRPCAMMAPLVDEMSKEYAGKLKVGKMDIDNNTNIPSELGIMNIPTLVIFKNGEESDRIVGVVSKSQLQERIKRVIS